MENVVRFPPRYLHPERSYLGREILRLVRDCGARNVDDLARMTGANSAIIDALLDRASAGVTGGSDDDQVLLVCRLPDL